MTKKLKPWTRDTPPNYVGDIEWIMRSPKSGLYVHVYIDEDKDDPARQAMQEISEALNELWEQQRVEIKHDPMDIENLVKAASEQLKDIISQDIIAQQQACIEELKANLAKAVKCLEKIAQDDTQALALKTLTELKGGSDD